MNKQILDVLKAEIAQTERFADTRPLRFPTDPQQIDAVIDMALRNPDWGTREILLQYHQDTGSRLGIRVNSLLEKSHIAKRDGREECAAEITQHHANLRLLIESQDAIQLQRAFSEIRQSWRRTDRSGPVIARVVLRYLARDLAQSRTRETVDIGKALQRTLQKTLLPPSRQLYRRVVRSLADAQGLGSSVSVDAIEDLIQEVDEIGSEETDTDAQDLESLMEVNADLRAALFGLRHELVALQERLRSAQEASQTNAIVALLRDMNSPTNNHLLDNIALSTRAVDDLIRSGWIPEPASVEGVVYSLKLLSDYLEVFGVTPVQTVGGQSRISMEDLSYVNYSGSEFRDEGQEKMVVFRTPGWRYKDQIITRPQAIEVGGLETMEG